MLHKKGIKLKYLLFYIHNTDSKTENKTSLKEYYKK